MQSDAQRLPGKGKKTFGGSALFGAAPEKANEQLRKQEHKNTARTASLTNQIMDSIEGYLDNIAAADTQTAANGGRLRN